MEDEVVSVPSSFRFRDHIADSSETEDSLSPAQHHHDLHSMAAKGIMHLCSELLELKRVSDEDFHQNLFSNYSAFVSIFREVEGLKKELFHLKTHVSTYKRLVEGFSDGTNINLLPNDSYEFIVADHVCLQPSPQSLFKAHFENVCEVVDVLLSEKRVDEALEILDSETKTLEDMQSQENLPLDVFSCYSSVLLEKKAKIVDQLKLVSEDTRVSQAELLKDLIRLRRVGDSHLATHLLFQYYHSRIVSGLHELQYFKSANGNYIHDVAKLVFSMICQATKTFLVLNGEESSYLPDLVQWTYEETEVFAACFNKYVQSISDINGGMVTVLEALRSAMSYCSLLENERLVLTPCLVKHIRPCLEEFLQNHIDHFKIVIGIFTSADTWVAGRYLLSGILDKESSSVVGEKQSEYCSLTSSGWKLVMVLQAITGNVVSLLAIQLEDLILRGLMDLLKEYVSLLESALLCKLNNLDKIYRGTNFAETLEQQVSLVANISSLAVLLSSIIRSAFNSLTHLTFEADSIIQFINESPDKLRGQLCQKFITKMMNGSGGRLIPETWVGVESRPVQLDEMMPSLVFQGLFFELKLLEKLAEDNFVDVNWLLELKRELMIAVLFSILNNDQLWKNTAEELAVKHSGNLKQFVLDVQFLVEIAKLGGYLCNNLTSTSSSLLSYMEAVFISAGLDPERATIDEEWAIKAAKESLKKLQETTETESPLDETIENHELNIEDSYSVCASDMPPKLDCISPQRIALLERERFDHVNSGDSSSSFEQKEDESAFDTTNIKEKFEHVTSLLEQLRLCDDGMTF